jgi:hypothetical protein
MGRVRWGQLVTTRRKKLRMGRPPLPAGDGKTARLHLALTDEELAAARAQADAHGVHVAEWARRRIVHDGSDPK